MEKGKAEREQGGARETEERKGERDNVVEELGRSPGLTSGPKWVRNLGDAFASPQPCLVAV